MPPSASGPARRIALRAAPVALAAAAVALLWSAAGRPGALRRSVSGAEARAAEALDRLPGLRRSLPGPDGVVVELWRVAWAEPSTVQSGDRATVVAMIDAEGEVRWSGQSAAISYIGRERFALRPCEDGRWCLDGPPLDRLCGVLDALLRRHRQIAAGGPGGAGEERHIRAWQIRIERERAEVGEDFSRAGEERARERSRLTLLLRDGSWVPEGADTRP